MKKFLSPLSKDIINNFKKGIQLDLSDYQYTPVIPEDFTGTLGKLYKREFINIKRRELDGKLFWWVSVTNSGLDFLKKFEAEKYSIIEN